MTLISPIRNLSWRWLIAAGVAVFWLAAATPAPVASAAGASQDAVSALFLPVSQNGPIPLCRLGINISLGTYNIRDLRLSWYLNYGATGKSLPARGIRYDPMIRLEQIGSAGYAYSAYADRRDTSPAELKAIIAANPGKHWFIGNEPDRIQYQDDIAPQIYAQAYHDLYALIKAEDPTAKIVAGAIVQPTPVRLQYLDLVVAAYQARYGTPMPVDAWAFHNFILNEVSCAANNDDVNVCWGADIPPGVNATEGMRISVQDTDSIDLFKQQVVRFRQWMADNGYQDTPALLSEFGVLFPSSWYPEFDPPRVNKFMDESFDFLLNMRDPQTGYPADDYRLVQSFAWYSTDDNQTHNGNLFDPLTRGRTPMGDNFAAYAAAMGNKIDLYPLTLKRTGVSASGQVLTAEIANSGNLTELTTAEVRFYHGDPAAGGQLIAAAPLGGISGCGGRETVQVEWTDVAPGDYQVYVVVDSTNRVGETNEANNVLSAAISVGR